MLCEDYLPLVEAFFDRILDEPEAGMVNAHLASCPACSDALEAMQQEQEEYAAYWREVAIKPPAWSSVLSAIKAERADSPAPEPGGKLAAFLSGWHLKPSFVTLAACVVLSVGLLSLIYWTRRGSAPPRQELAARPGDETIGVSNGDATLPESEAASGSPNQLRQPETKGEGMTASAPRVDSAQSPTRVSAVKSNEPNERRRLGAGRADVPVAAELTPSSASSAPASALTGAARYKLALRRSRELAAMPSLPSPGLAPNMRGKMAQHVERMQLLFLSLKNIGGEGQTLDVSYEKKLSRRLLNYNVLLRREAGSKGDLPLEELLGSIEPVLAEIASLPEQASRADVSQIKERIRKKGVGVLLNAYSGAPESEAERVSF